MELLAWYVKGSVYSYDQEIGSTLDSLKADEHLSISDSEEADRAVRFGLIGTAGRASYQVTSLARISVLTALGLNLVVFAAVLWPSRRSTPASPS